MGNAVTTNLNRPMVLYVDYIGTNDWGVWPRRFDAQPPAASDKPKWRGTNPLMLLSAAKNELMALNIPHTIHWSEAATILTENSTIKL